MNLFESFYASLYAARKKEGLPAPTSPLNGNIILALCLITFFGSLIGIIVLFFPGVGDVLDDLLKDLFGRTAGRTIGRLLVIIGLLIFFPIIRYTIGTTTNYKKILADFNALPESEREKVSKKGTWFIAVTLGSFVLPLLIWGSKSLF